MTERTTVPYPNVLCDDCGGTGYYEDVEDVIGIIQTPCESCGTARCEMELDHNKPADLPGESDERIDIYCPRKAGRWPKPSVDATFCSHECFKKYIAAGPLRSAPVVIENIAYSLKELPENHSSRKILIATGWNLFYAWSEEMEDQIRWANRKLRTFGIVAGVDQ